MHEKTKEQMREQIKIRAERQGVRGVQALRSLQSDAQLLYLGLFPAKKNPDGTTVRRKDGITPVTYAAAEMVLIANPQMESNKQVYSRSITALANEPNLDATRLQRTAVTARMKQGMDQRAGNFLESQKASTSRCSLASPTSSSSPIPHSTRPRP
jgi:hypothetical protein